jgi:hypothetical protein
MRARGCPIMKYDVIIVGGGPKIVAAVHSGPDFNS